MVTFFSSLFFCNIMVIILFYLTRPAPALLGAQELSVFRTVIRVLTGFAVIGLETLTRLK